MLQWLNKAAGVRYVGKAFEKCPGVDPDTTFQAIRDLAQQGRAIIIADRSDERQGTELQVVTKQSLLSGIESIKQSRSKGELGRGVDIDFSSFGNPAAVRRANDATIRRYQRLLKRLK